MKKVLGVIIYLGGILGLGMMNGGIKAMLDLPGILGVLLLSFILTFMKGFKKEDMKGIFKKWSKNTVYSGWIIFLIGVLGVMVLGNNEMLIPGIGISLISLLYGYIFASILENIA